MDEITLPMISREVPPRTISQDHLVSMQEIGESVRMRWVDGRLINLQFRVYTHLPMEEVQRIVERTISPFIYEPNNQVNRQRLMTLLQSRFHRAYIIN